MFALDLVRGLKLFSATVVSFEQALSRV